MPKAKKQGIKFALSILALTVFSASYMLVSPLVSYGFFGLVSLAYLAASFPFLAFALSLFGMAHERQ